MSKIQKIVDAYILKFGFTYPNIPRVHVTKNGNICLVNMTFDNLIQLDFFECIKKV